MVPVRNTVEISAGVRVELLFTPRISVYQKSLCDISALESETDALRIMEQYADLMYCAALNAWELDGHGTREDFPHTRGDFHGWMSADPPGFAKAVKFAVSAVSGKSLEELVKEGEKVAKNGPEKHDEGVKKKTRWFSRITSRLKRSS